MYQNESVEELCAGLQSWMASLDRPEPQIGSDHDSNWRDLIAALRLPTRSERVHAEA